MKYKYDIQKGLKRIRTKTSLTISALVLGAAGLGMAVAIPLVGHADSSNITFEPTTYSVGDINNQNGWSKTGAYDAAVVDNTSYGYSTLGTQSLRISNSVTSGSFGDQTFSPPLAQQAGETNSLDKTGTSVASPQPHFQAQFDIASTTKAEQTGMALSVSPDNGVGGRMSYLRFEDHSDGIHVFFDDVTDPTHATNADTFNETDIATLSYSATHTIKFSMDFHDGPDNDVVRISIDGSLLKTGTSWEDYYRYDTESNPTLVDVSRTIDSLLFREGGTAVSGNAGKGYLIDNLNLLSSAIPTVAAPTITSPANGSTQTSAQLVKVDWTDVTGTAPVTYQYQSFLDAGYTSLAYSSGWLSASEIPTPGTPNGDYYLQVRAQDGDGNMSPWSNDATNPYKITVSNLLPPPVTKADCDNKEWKTYNNPSFKNKDKCIDYVVKHGHKIKGDDVKYTAGNLKRSAEFEMNTYDKHKGWFVYSDANHDWYYVKVSDVSVSGHDGYFAGQVVKSKNNHYNGNWLFAKVTDNHPDQISGSFTSQTAAEAGVTNMTSPADGPFNVTKGNLKVN